MLTHCGYCGKKISKSASQVKKYEKHFCNMLCYTMYKKIHPELYTALKFNMNPQRKIKKFAALRKEMRT